MADTSHGPASTSGEDGTMRPLCCDVCGQPFPLAAAGRVRILRSMGKRLAHAKCAPPAPHPSLATPMKSAKSRAGATPSATGATSAAPGPRKEKPTR